jgi:hypothetical protein
VEKWDNFAFRLPAITKHLPQQVRQLGDVHCDAPRVVSGQQVRRRASARLILEVEITERLFVLVADDEAGIVVPI